MGTHSSMWPKWPGQRDWTWAQVGQVDCSPFSTAVGPVVCVVCVCVCVGKCKLSRVSISDSKSTTPKDSSTTT